MKNSKKENVKVPAAISYQSGWSLSQKVYHFLENKQLNNNQSEIFKTLKSSIYSV